MASWLVLAAALACLLARAGSVPANEAFPEFTWILTNQNRSISVPCTVPAHVLGVLHSSGLVQDPLYRFGELETRWVALEPWNFTAIFSATTSQLAHTDVMLFLDGVDTFGDVVLNGQYVAATDNFFRSYAVPVKQYLRHGANSISIIIQPALAVTARAKRLHPYTIPTLAAVGAFDLYNFARKPAFDFGWDWGPAFAPSGISGPVRMLAYSSAALSGMHVHQQHSDGDFTLMVECDIPVPQGSSKGTLTLSIPQLQVRQQLAQELSTPGMDHIQTTVNVSEDQVQLWWPVGYGPQPLYTLTATWCPQGVTIDQQQECSTNSTTGACATPANSTITGAQTAASCAADNSSSGIYGSSDSSCEAVAPVDARGCSSVQRRIGFRTVELVREPVAAAAPELLGSYSGWEDPVAAEEGQAGPIWPDPSQPDGQWALVNGRWQFIGNPVNATAEALGRDVYPHSGPEPTAQPGEEVIMTSAGTGGAQNANLSQAHGNSFYYEVNGHLLHVIMTSAGTGGAPDANYSQAEGESFYFRVNGQPLYAKGANLIPFNILSTNVSTQTIKATLDAALASNMNMVRVWGGGMYQAQALYDFCDEHGLLVWQETMFACAPYPRDEPFLANVAAEVHQQVRRLSHHPSVVLWGGNNEVEASMEWYNQTRSNLGLYAIDYNALFVETIHTAIQEAAPGTIFLDSSPSNGLISEEPYIKRWGNPQDPRYGDVHFYNYSADCQNFRTYPQAKFVSEFGFQSYSTWETYAEETAPEDWAVGAVMMEFRQRHGNGTAELLAQFSRHFHLPDTWADADPAQQADLFRSFLYLTHVQQLMCYETAISYWRRLRSQPQSLTMGVLYWQLNDVWAGASWSGRDYSGRWKALQYGIKRQFAPVGVQLVQDGPEAQVFVVNDLTTPMAITTSVQLHSMDDTAASCTAHNATSALQSTATVPPQNAVKLWAQNVTELLQQAPNCGPSRCYLTATIAAAATNSTTTSSSSSSSSGSSSSGNASATSDTSAWNSEAQLLFAPFKLLDLQAPNISLTNFTQLTDTSISFMAQSQRPAVLVLWQTPLHGHFSDSALMLHPCTPRNITFYSEQGPLTAEELEAALSVTSLWDHSFGASAPSAVEVAIAGGATEPVAPVLPTQGTLVTEGQLMYGSQ